MTPTRYFVRKLPGHAWAVGREHPSNEGTPCFQMLCVCDRPADAERVAYCMNVVAESEETDARDGVLTQTDVDAALNVLGVRGQP